MSNSSLAMALRPDRIAASPRARRLISRLGLQLRRVPRSGPGGRITEDHVRAAASQSAPMVSAPDTRPTAATVAPGRVSVMRRSIAERMALSFATIPHFHLRAEVDATELIRIRRHHRAAPKQHAGRGPRRAAPLCCGRSPGSAHHPPALPLRGSSRVGRRPGGEISWPRRRID